MKSGSFLIGRISFRFSTLTVLALLAASAGPASANGCASPPSGLVSWWQAEGNGADTAGTNTATAHGGLTYGAGAVGQTFVLDGTSGYLRIPASPSLDVGKGSGLTIEAWINPAIAGIRQIFEWNNSSGNTGIGVHFSVGSNNPGDLYANLIDTGVNNHLIASPGNTIIVNTFQHVAVTYDKQSGLAVLYRNGVVVQTANLGSFTPQTSFDAYIGLRPSGSFAGLYFQGDIDEPSVYSRALSASEVQAIYNAGSAGKCVGPQCTPPPAGIVAWWPAEGNGGDSVGTNTATPLGGVVYGPGEVGQTFVLNGSSAYLHIPASPSLDVGKGNGMTIEAWIDPALSGVRPIFEWNDGSGTAGIGAHFWVGTDHPGDLFANLVDTSDVVHGIAAPGDTIATNTFQHVAITYDKQSGLGVLYRNGVVVQSTNWGSFTPQTSFDAYIGLRPSGPFSGLYFQGEIDEPSVYNRALSASEIQAIYAAGNLGKCAVSALPVITSQPTNQNVLVGGTAVFSVGASSAQQLSYQWLSNTVALSAATNATLTLPNRQLNQSGTIYAVKVANATGFVLSSNALLTVNPLPVCTPPPAGIVAWWQAEGNGADSAGVNTATPLGGVAYGPGEVGQTFVLNGNSAYLHIPASPSLDVGKGGGLTIEAWINPAIAGIRQIFEWNNNTDDAGIGAHFAVGSDNPGDLYANLIDTGVNNHIIAAPGGTIATNTFQHVAITYDKQSGLGVLYCNGVVVQSTNWGSFTPQTSFDAYIGLRPAGSFAGLYFEGEIDEPSVYNRALSAAEIQAIYAAGTVGKCGNTLPIAGPDAIQRFGWGSVKVNTAALLANDTDPNNYPLAIIDVSPVSSAGGSVSLRDNWVLYAPASGFTNCDTFTYTVSNGHAGGTAVGTVSVQTKLDTSPSGNFSIDHRADGSVHLTFAGVPGWTYRIQYTEDLSAPNWRDLDTRTSGADGSFEYFDNPPANAPSRYYRSVWP